jgi:hypothetical protein
MDKQLRKYNQCYNFNLGVRDKGKRPKQGLAKVHAKNEA